jgi:serine/threonine-protein kinase
VPSLIGLLEAEALAAIEKVGLKSGERKTLPAPDRVGRVLAQVPVPGAKVEIGSSVSLIIGVQSKIIRVPSVVALSLKDASEAIKKAGLIVGKISGTSSEEGIVRDQDPKPETEVPTGTQVNVMVAPPAQTGIKELLKRMAADEGFDEIGVSADDLEKRFETAGINTKEQMASLLDRENEDLKSSLDLPNQKAARVLKRVLRKVLKED